jgi:hypothetical protein
VVVRLAVAAGPRERVSPPLTRAALHTATPIGLPLGRLLGACIKQLGRLEGEEAAAARRGTNKHASSRTETTWRVAL